MYVHRLLVRSTRRSKGRPTSQLKLDSIEGDTADGHVSNSVVEGPQLSDGTQHRELHTRWYHSARTNPRSGGYGPARDLPRL